MANSSRIIDGLKTNTTYSFWVRAKNSFGMWSDLSTIVTHTTLKDTSAPTAPATPTLTIAPEAFLFNWPANTEIDMRGGGYKLYVYTSNTPTSAKVIKQIGYTSEWAIVNVGEVTDDASITITAGTTYYFWLTTIDDSGNESGKTASSPSSGVVPPATSSISVGASPYNYQNTSGTIAQVIVNGGTVSLIEFSRNGSTYFTTGLTTGVFVLSPNDYLRVTYSSTPTMTLVQF